MVIKTTNVLNERDCVTSASLLDLCNSIPNGGWIALYFVFYTEEYAQQTFVGLEDVFNTSLA